MATIVFYEKPGCSTNVRQKQRLERSGHTVVARNLVTESWNAERLRSFFGELPTSAWFNATAPRVKSGAIDPSRIEPETALALLVAEPLLICRPLMEIGSLRLVGFDTQLLHELIGLGSIDWEPAAKCSGGKGSRGCSGKER